MLTDPGGLLATCTPPPELCGPDVTAWFEKQLEIIGAFSKATSMVSVTSWGPLPTGIVIDPVFKQFWKTLNFIRAKLSTQRCPTPVCSKSVALCGTCIDVTELGNIAFGYGVPMSSPALPLALFNPVGIALWGGFWIQVQPGGTAGFDKSSDFYGALAGVMLNGSGLSSICNALQRPFDQAFPGTLFDRISEFNTFYWLKSFTKTDVFAQWKKSTGMDPKSFVINATSAARNTAPLALAAKKGCSPCDQSVMPPDLQYNAQGTVSF